MRRVLPFLPAVLALLVACDAPRSATETADPATLRATSSAAAPAATVSFRRELSQNDHRFVLQTTGEGNQRQLQLRVEKNGRELTTTTQVVEGMVADAVAANLNDNKFPELLIFVTDAGSGSYGQLIGYEFLNQGRRNLTLPELTGPAAQGYQGHDEFRVQDGRVLRSFPIYLDADPNCCPTGGQRTIQYELPPEAVTFRQVSFSNQVK
ncbi:hypothetical protein [Hymenobacter psychrotolerans]|uniref:Uncharacterized protein n=1 Tax=Hymenobacter psychrotolerans DSM 18569 TaxID=1121959 RepID=A0A1M6T0P4_9BACT|nr:hypothetical protein [Hymenobacter psychrotolerans]SHK50514.1 hypothetical protein SAMN02746009_01041 [Hymenobacter psychrotolerans DSM 18569]